MYLINCLSGVQTHLHAAGDYANNRLTNLGLTRLNVGLNDRVDNTKYSTHMMSTRRRLTDYAMVNVRRKLYEPSSPAGKGTKWEWAGPNGSGDWHCYNMQVQCVIEAAWATVTNTHQHRTVQDTHRSV